MKTPAPIQSVSTSDAQRLRRIGELLCKAVILTEVNRAMPSVISTETNAEPAAFDPAAISDDQRIVAYLGLTGQGSPLAIRSALGLTRSAVYRSLLRLNRERQVVALGETRTLIYRLNQAEPPVGQIELN